MSETGAVAGVVCLDYADLAAGVDLCSEIALAFGYSGLGILTVKNVPNFTQAKMDLLPLAFRFATLPEEVKRKYEHPESFYSFGWSHGKERLQGRPDLSKGSFYANPQYDVPETNPAIVQRYPSFVHPNIWPTEEIPELQHAFKALGQLIVSVGEMVAIQCDAYIRQHTPSYPHSKLTSIIRSSRCCKARLLHYFGRSSEEIAVAPDADVEFSNWCGWHNDHGSLTGLVSAIYSDETGMIVPNTDCNAGLYIRSRSSELVKVSVPADQLAFQIGETSQIHSGGVLQATPHAVRGANTPGVSRQTFAVFMEPMFDEPMDVPEGVDPSQAQSASAAANLPRGVPPLASRWNPSMDFGQFTDATLSSYY